MDEQLDMIWELLFQFPHFKTVKRTDFKSENELLDYAAAHLNDEQLDSLQVEIAFLCRRGDLPIQTGAFDKNMPLPKVESLEDPHVSTIEIKRNIAVVMD